MKFFLIILSFGCCCLLSAKADRSLGPLYDRFPLTLDSGTRTEAVGPFFVWEENESQRHLALPPLFSCTRDPDVESTEIDFLYPVLTYDQYGSEYRWQILQLLSLAGGKTQEDEMKNRFTIFPIYFQQRSSNPEFNYTALFPIYGTIRNRLFRDEIRFVLFPLYSTTRRKDVVTDNYLYPIFHLRRGEQLRGWQIWPLVGAEHKEVTTFTNGLDEMELVGGHEKFFALWPIFLKNTTGIGTTNVTKELSVLPLFSTQRSTHRDSWTAPWPLGFTRIEDRGKKYKEIGAPWPFIVFAHGEGKNTQRIWPLFSRASTANLESSFYLWPIYKYNGFHTQSLERERTRILFFLYSDLALRNLETGDAMHRVDFFPFFTFRRDLNGNERLQILSILEPILPNNKSIERNYSQLWSIWRWENNAQTGASSRSLLWNLYRCDKTETSKKRSIFFGLFQYESVPEGNFLRLFYLPLGIQKNRDNALTKEESATFELIGNPNQTVINQ